MTFPPPSSFAQTDIKGTIDIVNTVKYMPIELGLKKSIKAALGEDSEEYKKASGRHKDLDDLDHLLPPDSPM